MTRGNRVTIPKEFRENFSLKPPKLLRLTLSAVDGGWKSIEFYTHLMRDGQVTIPVELFRVLELRHGQTIFVHVYID